MVKVIKRNTKVILAASAVVVLEGSIEKIVYMLASRQQNAGRNYKKK